MRGFFYYMENVRARRDLVIEYGYMFVKTKEEGPMAKSINDILTYTGIYMDPFVIKPENINIYDIAHALSMMTRANGHIAHFYSVAQHCINCAAEAKERGQSVRMQLVCLLHDAAESYIADVPRPVKHRLTGYAALEHRALAAVFSAFGIGALTEEEATVLGEIDDAMLYFEFKVMKDVEICDVRPHLFAEPDLAEHPITDIEQRYLQLFRQLYQRTDEI